MAKPVWVFTAGTYRSGSTTQYRICRDIVERTGNGIGIGYHTEGKLKEHDKPKHPFVVCKVFDFLPEGFHNIHEEGKHMPSYGSKFFTEGRMKSVVTIRDPRDIIVSMRNREEGRNRPGQKVAWDFETTVRENFPAWLEQLVKWIDLGPDITLVSKFELMTQNLNAEVRRIAQHLDIDLAHDMRGAIAKQYTVPALRRAKRQHQQRRKEDKGAREDPWLPGIPAINFGTSGMHETWLSGPERKLVEGVCEGFMKRFGYS
jgi:hypothetical protein